MALGDQNLRPPLEESSVLCFPHQTTSPAVALANATAPSIMANAAMVETLTFFVRENRMMPMPAKTSPAVRMRQYPGSLTGVHFPLEWGDFVAAVVAFGDEPEHPVSAVGASESGYGHCRLCWGSPNHIVFFPPLPLCAEWGDRRISVTCHMCLLRGLPPGRVTRRDWANL